MIDVRTVVFRLNLTVTHCPVRVRTANTRAARHFFQDSLCVGLPSPSTTRSMRDGANRAEQRRTAQKQAIQFNHLPSSDLRLTLRRPQRPAQRGPLQPPRGAGSCAPRPRVPGRRPEERGAPRLSCLSIYAEYRVYGFMNGFSVKLLISRAATQVRARSAVVKVLTPSAPTALYKVSWLSPPPGPGRPPARHKVSWLAAG